MSRNNKHKTPEDVCNELGLPYNALQQEFVNRLAKQLVLAMQKENLHWTTTNLNILKYMKGKQ